MCIIDNDPEYIYWLKHSEFVADKYPELKTLVDNIQINRSDVSVMNMIHDAVAYSGSNQSNNQYVQLFDETWKILR